jgi:hypothetical protein
MKKILGLFFVLFAVAFVMSSEVCAASSVSTIASSNGVYTFGSEWLAGQTADSPVNFNGAVITPGGATTWTSTIQYIPVIDLGINNTIKIRITNGAVKKTSGNTYTLWNNTTGIRCATMIDYLADGNGNYTEMTFQFLQTVGPTAPSVISGATLYMTEDTSGVTDPTFVTNFTLLSAGDTQVQVFKATDSTTQNLIAPLTAPASVITKIDQLSAKVQHLVSASYEDGNATSVINVEATPISRSKFVDEGILNDTRTTTSEFYVYVTPATVNNGILLDNASYTLTLGGDQTAINRVDLDGLDFTRGSNQWNLTSTFASHNLRTHSHSDVSIRVNGSTIIDTASYTITLVITPAEAGVGARNVLTQATAAVWTVNAMQARIPYMLVDTRTTGNSGYGSFFEITNRSSQDAKVSLDAIISNENGTSNEIETATDVMILPANSVTILRQENLDTWFTKIDNTKLYRVSLVLTVVAPQNMVDVTAWHIGPTTRTSANVLYNTDNILDGRKWQ